MKLEVKYIFPTSTPGVNNYIYKLFIFICYWVCVMKEKDEMSLKFSIGPS